MASTYVNDLRLNEMATGDASGSWGTVTNTNLELIGEAFSYGTETIGDADSTLTIADGAADAARSFYLKITSSVDLTTTRIVTLGPNTVSKVWMIENATTGSQVITIKQGSGATINVPNGQVKMISTDGAGSGGAVLDLLVDVDLTGTTTLVNLDVSGTLGVTGVLTATSLDISGDIDVDGTTNLDVVDIDGATQIDATVTVGVDDTGYDVKFFGATAGAYMLWDESADDLILGGAAGLSVNSTALVTGVLTTTAATVFNGGFAAGGVGTFADGSNSAPSLTNTGDLNTGLYFPAADEVGLTVGGTQRLNVNATGIDVTGTVTADGLTATTADINGGTIDGTVIGGTTAAAGTFTALTADGVATVLTLQGAGTNYLAQKFSNTGGNTYLGISNSAGGGFLSGSGNYSTALLTESATNIAFGTTNAKRQLIEANGDISFYEDTGTTAKFFWDASAEELQLGDNLLALTPVTTGTTGSRISANGGGMLRLASGGSDKMYVLDSGNVGIGTSSPSGKLTLKAGDNTYAGGFRLEGTDETTALAITHVNGNNYFSGNAADDHLVLTGSGDVGIGTTSPATKLDVVGSTTNSSGIVDTLRLRNTGTTENDGARIQFTAGESTSGAGIGSGGKALNSADLRFYSGGNTERMRIAQNGSIVYYGSTVAGAGGASVGSIVSLMNHETIANLELNNQASTGYYAKMITNGGSQVGSISYTAAATAYNTSSDYRLKTDAQPMTGASARVQALKPVNFEWISSGERVDGFLAHEAQAVVPECVTGTKDAMRDQEYEVTAALKPPTMKMATS
jgi:hypothetical protein